MISTLKTVSLFLAVTVLSNVALAAGLQEGSYKGKSSLINNNVTNHDVMAFLIKKDPSQEGRYHAVLAEYTRLPFTTVTVRTAITKWVPRLYAYRLEKISDLEYSVQPLRVSDDGDIEINPKFQISKLKLQTAGQMDGAVLVRMGQQGQKAPAETISFKGRVGSTWEDFIPGNYFGTNAKTGGDYFSKAINTELTQDKVAHFNMDSLQGKYNMTEKVPGMFVFTSRGQDGKGAEKALRGIGVFIDIVNWKPVMTTDELLIINPDNASDVGFFYERE